MELTATKLHLKKKNEDISDMQMEHNSLSVTQLQNTSLGVPVQQPVANEKDKEKHCTGSH